ncbi:hypothetical protein Acr_13g0000160 [Actinidia rufa]|uniref:Uncharacterized protein n=1 Tax=Actinidia rufa TaxID=165716 RepID=A0A7J0FIU9_9ERIC|nr:hypothetical protein Acr_13g0000160 [Actinidia rufa]
MDSDHESVSIWEDEYEFGDGDGNGNRNDHPHSNISRLSMCNTSSSTTVYGHDDEDEDSMTRMFMSRLSMEDDQGYGDHGDADADVDEEFKDEGKLEISGGLFLKYDYDKEPLGLQATPPGRRNHRSQQKQIEGGLQGVAKEYYTSKYEGHDHLRRRRRRSRGGMMRDEMSSNSSEGGRRWRCLCMGLEEVKACSCRDPIGFHLEHHRRHPHSPSQ